MSTDRIGEIEEKIADLKVRWPRPPHLVPPLLWQQLEELEDALEVEKKKRESE